MIRKGDKVVIVKEDCKFKNEEGLVTTCYCDALVDRISVVVFNGVVPRELLWLEETDVRKLREEEIQDLDLINAR